MSRLRDSIQPLFSTLAFQAAVLSSDHGVRPMLFRDPQNINARGTPTDVRGTWDQAPLCPCLRPAGEKNMGPEMMLTQWNHLRKAT